ncbi:MAG TPA: cytochrome c oxidase subunit II [Gammaproteobacteria bacterium]
MASPRTAAASLLAALLLSPLAALANSSVNMRQGVTPLSRDIYDLHMLITWVCVAIGLVVFGAMFYSIFKHRKAAGAKAAHFHENVAVEVVWTIVPFVILIGMAIPATKTLLAIEDVGDADISIQVTGYQWKWKYAYLDHDIDFFSNLSTTPEQINNQQPKGEHYLLEVDQPLVVPVNKKIRFLITSNDVIHSFWAPDLGVKRDAVPGFINASWATIEEPGIYRGQCTELCGVNHGFMPVVIDARSQADFDQWVVGQKAEKVAMQKAAEETWTMARLMQHGAEVYARACSACHQANGKGLPGAFPALDGSALTIGPLDAHLGIVLNGKPGTAMQAFGAQLNDADIAAVVTYERNAWSNATGDAVQPAQVKAAR